MGGRDTFFNLQFPVDAGYNYVGYEFEPDTGYTYYFGCLLYAQENLKEKIKIDGQVMKEIELTANRPEIVLFKIPSELYSDEKIELKFEKIYYALYYFHYFQIIKFSHIFFQIKIKKLKNQFYNILSPNHFLEVVM